MIIDIDEAKAEFPNLEEAKLIKKLKAIEKSIRKYTNNNFMDIKFRTYGKIENGLLIAKAYPYFAEKDNIQLSHCLNNGVYTIDSIEQNQISFVEQVTLLDCNNVMITKVVYPEDIQDGVKNMLKWDLGLRNKVGIKSETISRHSVTYFDMDVNNSLKGYPASLLGFLEDYIKARF